MRKAIYPVRSLARRVGGFRLSFFERIKFIVLFFKTSKKAPAGFRRAVSNGVYLAFLVAVISGLANFFNKFAMTAIGKNAYQYTTLKNILVALALTLVVLTPFIWNKIKKLSVRDWGMLAIIGLVGGGIPFLLFFKGLSLTSAVSASFIHKTLFIWVALLAWPFLKERVTKVQFLALGILLWGNMIFEGFKGFNWGRAEMMILGATILWAIENIIAKVALKKLDSLVVGWGRMFFGSLVLLGFLLMTNNLSGLLVLRASDWGWLALVSALLLAYVVCWYGAIKRLPVTVVASVLVLASPITTFLNSAFVTHKLSVDKIWGAIIIVAAILIIVSFKNNKQHEVAAIKI